MKHPDETQLNDYLDHLLGPAERDEIETHLATCSACRKELAALEQVFTLLNDLDEAPLSADLSVRVLKQLAAPRALTSAERRLLAGAVGAALGLLASLGQMILSKFALAGLAGQVFRWSRPAWGELVGLVNMPAFNFPTSVTSIPWNGKTLTIMAIAASVLWVLGNVSLMGDRKRVEK